MEWEEEKEGKPNPPKCSSIIDAAKISSNILWFKWLDWNSIYKSVDYDSEWLKCLSNNITKIDNAIDNEIRHNKNKEGIKISRNAPAQPILNLDIVEYNFPKDFTFGPNFGSLVIRSDQPYSWNVNLTSSNNPRRVMIITRRDNNRDFQQIYNLDGISTINSLPNESRNINSVLQSFNQEQQYVARDERQPANQETIDNLVEASNYKDEHEETKDEPDPLSWSICTAGITNKAVKLNWSHIFHKECIVQWLKIHHIWPIWRVPVD